MIASLLILLAPQAEPPKGEKRTDAVRRLYEKDRAEAGDALRLFLALSKGAPVEGTFDALRKEAVDRGLADAGWELADGKPVDKGTVAYLLVKTLGIKGGLTMAVFGPSRRYAFRECLYLKLISGGTPGEFVSGRELLDILTAAERWKAAGNLDADRK